MRRSNTSAETDLEFHIKFLAQFIIHPTKTGAIAPSSDALSQFITDMAELGNVSSVIEFGSGTGVITEKILERISPDTTFFAMEINQTFVETTKRRCPEAVVYESSATNAMKHLELHGEDGCDCIISSLPWSTFSEDLQDDLLKTITDVLRPGGKFLTYAYLPGLIMPTARRFRRKLEQNFDTVKRSKTIWSNFPPAFVYHAQPKDEDKES